MAEPVLRGLRVVVTRPLDQAAALTARLRECGAEVIGFPVLAIQPPADPAQAARRLQDLTQYQQLIFVSANAVHGALALRPGPWSEAPAAAAIGRATAAALDAAGFQNVLYPAEQFNTEGLLAMREFQEPAVRNGRLLILRGQGGRETLADTLRGRGARVDYAEVYCRVRPATDPAQLLRALERRQVDLVTVTSQEALHNLLALAGPAARQRLLSVRFLVVSERVAAAARESGCRLPPLVADQPGDEGMLRTILRWHDSEDSSGGRTGE